MGLGIEVGFGVGVAVGEGVLEGVMVDEGLAMAVGEAVGGGVLVKVGGIVGDAVGVEMSPGPFRVRTSIDSEGQGPSPLDWRVQLAKSYATLRPSDDGSYVNTRQSSQLL